MLAYDQTKRPSALEALKHPFVCQQNAGGTDGTLDSADVYEAELRNAAAGTLGGASYASGGGGSGAVTPKKMSGSETGRFAKKKDPPQRLKSTKGKVVAKPEKPRTNNATKKSRMKPGGGAAI